MFQFSTGINKNLKFETIGIQPSKLNADLCMGVCNMEPPKYIAELRNASNTLYDRLKFIWVIVLWELVPPDRV